jgi:hypothetical protein
VTDFASFAGQRITAGSIALPLYGLWSGDVALATNDPVQDNGAFVLGNLTMRGHVYRQAQQGGVRMCRIVGGFGGWRKTIGPIQYAQSSGVMLGMVLKDAAREVGEQVNVPNDVPLGPMFVRKNAPASDVLRQAAGKDWHVDPAGVTQIQAWPTKAIGSAFTVESQDGARGLVTIATEDYAGWTPASTFTAPFLNGTFTVGGLLFRFDADGHTRLEVLTSP